MKWKVYRYSVLLGTRKELGKVEAPHQPAARLAAYKRFRVTRNGAMAAIHVEAVPDMEKA